MLLILNTAQFPGKDGAARSRLRYHFFRLHLTPMIHGQNLIHAKDMWRKSGLENE